MNYEEATVGKPYNLESLGWGKHAYPKLDELCKDNYEAFARKVEAGVLTILLRHCPAELVSLVFTDSHRINDLPEWIKSRHLSFLIEYNKELWGYIAPGALIAVVHCFENGQRIDGEEIPA